MTSSSTDSDANHTLTDLQVMNRFTQALPFT